MSEWQPIETAPKNTKIIVGYYNNMGYWRCLFATYYTNLFWPDDYEPSADESEYAPEGWYEESEVLENLQLLEKTPTRWMPEPCEPKNNVL